jgi:hypothetical protein
MLLLTYSSMLTVVTYNCREIKELGTISYFVTRVLIYEIDRNLINVVNTFFGQTFQCRHNWYSRIKWLESMNQNLLGLLVESV